MLRASNDSRALSWASQGIGEGLFHSERLSELGSLHKSVGSFSRPVWSPPRYPCCHINVRRTARGFKPTSASQSRSLLKTCGAQHVWKVRLVRAELPLWVLRRLPSLACGQEHIVRFSVHPWGPAPFLSVNKAFSVL